VGINIFGIFFKMTFSRALKFLESKLVNIIQFLKPLLVDINITGNIHVICGLADKMVNLSVLGMVLVQSQFNSLKRFVMR